MLDLLRWYLVIQAIGFAALPLTARAFRGLPDRGYAFARPVGMLAVTVALWMGAIYGIWPNTGAMVAILVIALGVTGWVGLRRSVDDLRVLWRTQRAHLYVVEGLFLVALLVWAFCRAHFPEIEATEKPMELGFLNGILRSQRFPPVDPWLSGSSISYYYLGYVMVAAVTELAGVVPSVAFNLAIATLFALTVTGAFAVGYALVEGLRRTRGLVAGDSLGPLTRWPSWVGGGLAAAFVTLLGNWEGFLEVLHAHGIGSEAFYNGLALYGLGKPAYQSTTWYPNETQDFYWWFHASRVITDYPFNTTLPPGFTNYNTINEFPFFSFLLGDLHPHVLALPFAFVCLGFALSFLRASVGWVGKGWRPLPSLFPEIDWFDLAFIAGLYGAMFLLNAWDMLTYLFVLVCAFAIRSYLDRPALDWRWLRQSVLFGGLALVAGLLLYWPFYVTFRSQASGLLGIVTLHSHLSYFVIFWGPFLFLAGSLLVAELGLGVSPLGGKAIPGRGPAWTRHPAFWIGVALVAVLCYAFQAPALTLVVPMLLGSVAVIVRYVDGRDLAMRGEVESMEARREKVAVGAGRDGQAAPVAGGAVPASLATEHVYVFVLLFVGMLLLLGTELVFIQDSFHNRMNTVFKLYFQAWEMLALVSAYAAFYLSSAAFARPLARVGQAVAENVSRFAAAVWLAVVVVLAGAAFVYAPAALEARSNGFTNPITLDGLEYYARFQPDDAAAIAWLNQNVPGTPTIVEATGGSYSEFGEVAWMTGLPTLLGWDFHEIQWRGEAVLPIENDRKRDIDTIYQTTDNKTAQALLQKYGATFVYVGPMEKNVYKSNPAGLAKFGQFMDVAYRNGSVTIYQRRGKG
jgi:YYY domain-containing protein